MMWRSADALKEHYVPSFIRVGMWTWIRPNLRLVPPAHPNPDHHKTRFHAAGPEPGSKQAGRQIDHEDKGQQLPVKPLNVSADRVNALFLEFLSQVT